MRRGRKKKKRKHEVDLKRLDDYTSLLYEIKISRKVEGSKKIRLLLGDENNWEYLISNVSLLNLLARVLKNYGKESINLNFNILYFFYVLSKVEKYQERILSYGILDIILERIDYENGRYHRIIDTQIISKDLSKMVDFIRTQTKLLTVCLYLLLNLFGKIELNIRKLVTTLLGMLKRHSTGNHNHILAKCAPEVKDLLVVVIQLLQQLIQISNGLKTDFEEEITQTLIDLISYPSDDVILNVLRFFSYKLENPNKIFLDRVSLLIPSLLKLITKPKLHLETLKILYLFSKKKEYVEYFQVSLPELQKKSGFELVLEIIKRSPDERYLREELVALGINLAVDLGMEISKEDFDCLLKKLCRTKDPLLSKMVRNLSQHENIRPLFKPFLKPLTVCINKSPELTVEVLGILGNTVTIPDMSYRFMFSAKYRFEKSLNRCLRMEKNEDDVLLEAIILSGVVLCKKDSGDIAKIIAKTTIIPKICDIFVRRLEDEEFVLQSLYTFYSLLHYEETKSMLLLSDHDECIESIIGLFDHQNVFIKKVVDLVLDVIMDCNEKYKINIVRKKFEMHNAEWCAYVNQEENVGGEGMNHLGTSSYLTRSRMNSASNYHNGGFQDDGGGGGMMHFVDDTFDDGNGNRDSYVNQVTDWGNEIRFDD